MKDVVVACGQVQPILGDLAANREITTAAILAAAASGARVIVLPELASSGYAFEDGDEARAAAEPADGPAVTLVGSGTQRTWTSRARRPARSRPSGWQRAGRLRQDNATCRATIRVLRHCAAMPLCRYAATPEPPCTARPRPAGSRGVQQREHDERPVPGGSHRGSPEQHTHRHADRQHRLSGGGLLRKAIEPRRHHSAGEGPDAAVLAGPRQS